MWILVLLAVNIHDPQDQPGRIELEFKDKPTCEQVLSTMTYQLKFKNFKVQGTCQPKPSS
jgi:hypothetical protein